MMRRPLSRASHCVHCGGPLKLMASIDDPWVIQKILRHLDAPARGPPHRALQRNEMQLSVNWFGLRTDGAPDVLRNFCLTCRARHLERVRYSPVYWTWVMYCRMHSGSCAPGAHNLSSLATVNQEF